MTVIIIVTAVQRKILLSKFIRQPSPNHPVSVFLFYFILFFYCIETGNKETKIQYVYQSCVKEPNFFIFIVNLSFDVMLVVIPAQRQMYFSLYHVPP